jgi:transposase
MSQGKRPTPEFRREAERTALTSEIAEDLGICLSTQTRQVGRERDVGEPVEVSTNSHAGLQRLRRENAVLRQGRDVSKKIAQPSSSTTQVDKLCLRRCGGRNCGTSSFR